MRLFSRSTRQRSSQMGWALLQGLVVVGLALVFTFPGCGKPKSSSEKSTTTADASTTTDSPTTDTSTPQPDDNTVQEKPPQANTSCASILICGQSQCASPLTTSCLAPCAAKVTGDGQTRWNQLQTCWTQCESTCTAGDASCIESCLNAQCSAFWIACASDGKAGARTCQETSLCSINCDKKDQSCRTACLANASQAAQQAYASHLQCKGKAAQQALTPQEQKDCFDKEIACLCPQHQAGTGTGTCNTYLTCVTPCKDNTCCIAKCRADLQASAVAPADTFIDCIVQQCSACPDGDQACVDKCAAERCAQPLLACLCPGVGTPGSGNQSCNDGLKCAQKCSSTDLCCAARCTAKLKAKSYKKFEDLVKCLPKCGCKDGDNRCLEKCGGFGGKCNKQAVACSID